MSPQPFWKIDIEIFILFKSTIATNTCHNHLPAFIIWIELIISDGIQRVSPANTFTVTTYLDHLRPEGKVLFVRVLMMDNNATQPHLACQRWIQRIGNTVLMHLTQAPSSHIQVFIIEA